MIKIFSGNDEELLEKSINEFFADKPLIRNLIFHYSTSSGHYFDQETKDGDITWLYSVLVSYNVVHL